MRKALTTSQLPPIPEHGPHRERVAVTSNEVQPPARAARQAGVKGFVDVLKTSDLGPDRKLKAPVEETAARKGGRAKKES